VLSADGTEVRLTEVVELGDHRRCSCGFADHTAITAEKLDTLHRTVERRLPAEALTDLEQDLRTLPEPQETEGEYDGGYNPSGIGWFDDEGQPTDGNSRIAWEVDAPHDTPASRGPAACGFLADLAGGDAGGRIAQLAPIVERVMFRTVTFPPRVAGDWGDLFQEGMITALREASALSAKPGESVEGFTARRQRRVALSVKHRLIDLVRRQDAATRNTPTASLEASQDAGLDVAADNSDPFDLLVQQSRETRRDSRVRAIALAVHRRTRGLTRRMAAAAYLAVFHGGGRGTLRFRENPGYPEATRSFASAWGEALTQALRGALQPVDDRMRRSRTRCGSPSAVA